MTIHHRDDRVTLHHGDALDVLRTLPDASVDAVVTDPPYGLREYPRRMIEDTLRAWLSGDRAYVPDGGAGFMGRAWDRFVPPPAAWDECFRVLKPGGHLLAFAGTRTFDLMAMSIRLAGLTTDTSPEVRDSIAWLYGSGFPKSLDVSKAIDKAAGAEREPSGAPTSLACEFVRAGTRCEGHEGETATSQSGLTVHALPTAPATDAAREWAGWGTALKPAFEPVVVARKPLVGTVVANVTTHGTGALNIDGCRIAATDKTPPPRAGYVRGETAAYAQDAYTREQFATTGEDKHPNGRWPANVILDEDMADVLDEQSGTLTSGANPTRRGSDKFRNAYGDFRGQEECTPARGVDKGGASRFFYVAKAPKRERPVVDGVAHPTVKPLALMRWLVRLVTPPGGTVLEPFAGSGTTVEACLIEGFQCIAIEKGDEYLPLILARIARQAEPVPELAEIVRTIDPDAEVVAQVFPRTIDVPLFDFDGGVTA